MWSVMPETIKVKQDVLNKLDSSTEQTFTKTSDNNADLFIFD